MLNNQAIVNRIRGIGHNIGLGSDAAICKACDFSTRSQLARMTKLKTAPQLDTLAKFAKGLKCTIEDIVYDRSEADINLSRLIGSLTEYEKTKVVVYVEMLIAEKNKKEKKVV